MDTVSSARSPPSRLQLVAGRSATDAVVWREVVPCFPRVSFSFPSSPVPPSFLRVLSSLHRIKGPDYRIRGRPRLRGGLHRSPVRSQASCSAVLPPGGAGRRQHLPPGPLRPCVSSGQVSAGPRFTLQAPQSRRGCSAPR